MATKKNVDPFDDEKTVDDVFDTKHTEENVIICPQCGARVKPNAQYCTYCGSKLETVKEDEEQPKVDEEVENVFEDEEPKPAAPKKPRYDEHHRLIREDGEAPKENFVSSENYKYGDGKGHSVSTISLYWLGASFFLPIIPFIVSLMFLGTKNEKDKKIFKASMVINVIITIIEVVVIYLKATGKID